MRYADPLAQNRIDELEIEVKRLQGQISEIRKICDLDNFWRTPERKVVRVTEQYKGYSKTESMIRVSDIEKILS